MEKTYFNPIFEHYNIDYKSCIQEYKEQIDYNNYIVSIDGKDNNCFMKTIPLVDYIKYLIGKYKKYNICLLPTKENNCNNVYDEYIHSIHNYAYVDNFFYILSSQLNVNGFKHGINVYDSYISLKENCEINIVDDFEYLCDSNYFNDNLNKLFKFKDDKIHSLFSNLKKPPIELSEENIDIEYDVLEDVDVIDHKLQSIDISMDLIHEKEVRDETDSSSEESDSSTEGSEDSEDNYSTDTQSDESNESIMDELVLIINKIPSQNIILEKCVDTLDSLFESGDINIEQLTSSVFQIVLMLYVYQNVFHFTHNDLHTNNIMYVDTTEEFLYYKIKGHFYKVPTYGKLYKLIDFGRAIYTYADNRLCSDSFSSNGTAHGQYNCEPFYNKNKPKIEPNYSFDLCRLACSMFDFIIDDLKDIETFRNIPIYDMIISWVYDDNSNNVLYKKNGDERYPDFKLYKMISKNVNNHIPEKQFDHKAFNHYKQEMLETFVDIDELIKMKVHL
tara:strand:+ start:921 stop:2426 length:1506 start_codon:yes stop_codon:yes gene_type:complete